MISSADFTCPSSSGSALQHRHGYPRRGRHRVRGLTQRLGTSVALAFILGTLSVLAFAPFEAFPLLWLTSAGFYVLLCRTRDLPRVGRRSALLGGSFGLGLFLGGVYWLFISMHTYGGMPALVAALLTLLFCAYLALYPTLAAWAFVRLAPESRLFRRYGRCLRVGLPDAKS